MVLPFVSYIYSYCHVEPTCSNEVYMVQKSKFFSLRNELMGLELQVEALPGRWSCRLPKTRSSARKAHSAWYGRSWDPTGSRDSTWASVWSSWRSPFLFEILAENLVVSDSWIWFWLILISMFLLVERFSSSSCLSDVLIVAASFLKFSCLCYAHSFSWFLHSLWTKCFDSLH